MYKYLYLRLKPDLINELRAGLDNQEVLFRLFGSLCKAFNLSYEMYIVILSTISMYFLVKTVIDYSEYPLLSIILYYCFFMLVWTFSALRQGIVLVIGMYYLLESLHKGRNLKFLFIAMVLFFFHYSAVMLLLIHIFLKFKWSFKSLVLVSFTCIFISLLPVKRIALSLSWVPLMNKAIYYMNDRQGLLLLDFPSIVRIIFLLGGLAVYKQIASIDKMGKCIITIFILSLDVYFFFKFSEITASRLSIYGYYLSILLLPKLYVIQKKKADKGIFLFFLCCGSFLYLTKEINSMAYLSKLSYDSTFVPYTSIFNKSGGVTYNVAPYILEIINS